MDKLSSGSILRPTSIEVGSWGGEKTDPDISLRADLGKRSNLSVAKHLDAASLTNTMKGAADLVGLFESGLECFRGFRAANFYSILSTVLETLFRSRFVVSGWQIEFFESLGGSFHDLTKRGCCP